MTYSFSIDNIAHELTGNCNFSVNTNLKLDISLKNPAVNDDKKYMYDIYLYRTYYNIITYNNGTAAIKYGD